MQYKIEQVISANKRDRIVYIFTAEGYGEGKDIISAIMDSGVCKSKKEAKALAIKLGWPETLFKK